MKRRDVASYVILWFLWYFITFILQNSQTYVYVSHLVWYFTLSNLLSLVIQSILDCREDVDTNDIIIFYKLKSVTLEVYIMWLFNIYYVKERCVNKYQSQRITHSLWLRSVIACDAGSFVSRLLEWQQRVVIY